MARTNVFNGVGFFGSRQMPTVGPALGVQYVRAPIPIARWTYNPVPTTTETVPDGQLRPIRRKGALSVENPELFE
jgi:hypothetical protein